MEQRVRGGSRRVAPRGQPLIVHRSLNRPTTIWLMPLLLQLIVDNSPHTGTADEAAAVDPVVVRDAVSESSDPVFARP